MRRLSSRFWSAVCGVWLLAGLAWPLGAAALPLAPKVLIVGIDGVRPDALAAAGTPSFDALVVAGAFSDQARTGEISLSGPGWSSALTGVWAEKHGVVNNQFVPNNLAAYPPIFQRLAEVAPQLETAVIGNWIPVPVLLGAFADFRFRDEDPGVAALAAELLATGDPDLLMLHFDAPDAAGHAFGFDPSVPEYLAAIESVDAHIGTLVAAIASRPSIAQEDWLVLSTTDHGGLGTSHGGPTPEERTIFYLASGPSAQLGTLAEPPGIVDVAVTALAHLRVPIDPAWGLDGKVAGLRPVPELGAGLLLGCGLVVLAGRARLADFARRNGRTAA